MTGTPRRLPVLIGEAPARERGRYHAWPLSGRPAHVLCTLAEIEPHDDEAAAWARWTFALYDHFECRNLFGRHDEAEPWRVKAARIRARDLVLDFRGRVVVCLGRRVHAAVWSALDPSPTPEFHEWRSFPSVTVAGIPHPSGLNRLLNEESERRRCGETLRLAMRKAELPGARP